MHTSLHLQLRNTVATLLATVAEKVTTGRRVAMADQDSEQVFVYLDTSQMDRAELQGQPDDWSTRIRIELCARELAGQPAEDRADSLATAAYSLLMAAGSALIPLCIDAHAIGIGWATDEADTGLAVAQIVLEVTHRTSAVSIAA